MRNVSFEVKDPQSMHGDDTARRLAGFPKALEKTPPLPYGQGISFTVRSSF